MQRGNMVVLARCVNVARLIQIKTRGGYWKDTFPGLIVSRGEI